MWAARPHDPFPGPLGPNPLRPLPCRVGCSPWRAGLASVRRVSPYLCHNRHVLFVQLDARSHPTLLLGVQIWDGRERPSFCLVRSRLYLRLRFTRHTSADPYRGRYGMMHMRRMSYMKYMRHMSYIMHMGHMRQMRHTRHVSHMRHMRLLLSLLLLYSH